MAFVNLPLFKARQLLTAALLNQVIAAMQGFSTQTADISWPLFAGGNIDMDSTYTIDNMRTLWNVVNADEYATLADAIAAVASGGCVFIPPRANGGAGIDGTTGVTITASNVWIVGCGPDSRVRLTSGVGPLFDTDNNLSNIGFMNLQLIEESANGGGIVFRRTTSPVLINVLFTNFDGNSVYYTNDGVAGNSCADAYMNGVAFSSGGAAGNHIKADDLDGLFVTQTLSKTAGGTAFLMEPSAANSIIRDIQMDATVRVESPGSKGISILGEAAASDDKYSRISLLGTKVVTPTGTAFEIGAANKIMREVQLVGCAAQGTMAGFRAFHVNAERGDIKDCRTRAAGFGIDLEDSVDLDVQGNSLRSCTVGIDASGLTASSGVAAWNNNLTGSTVPINFPTGTDTGFEVGNNVGYKGKLMGGAIYKDFTANNGGTTGSPVVMWTYTIPGGTLIKEGDGFVVSVAGFAGTDAAHTGNLIVSVDANTILNAVNAAGTSHEYIMRVETRINAAGADAATNTDSWASCVLAGTTEEVAGATEVDTIDWTSDVDVVVSIQSSKASHMTGNFGSITFFEGETGGV